MILCLILICEVYLSSSSRHAKMQTTPPVALIEGCTWCRDVNSFTFPAGCTAFCPTLSTRGSTRALHHIPHVWNMIRAQQQSGATVLWKKTDLFLKLLTLISEVSGPNHLPYTRTPAVISA